MSSPMKFDGRVGNLGDKGSVTYYDVSYVGKDLAGLEAFVKERCRMKGVEVMSLVNEKNGEGWKVTAHVKSLMGIV